MFCFKLNESYNGLFYNSLTSLKKTKKVDKILVTLRAHQDAYLDVCLKWGWSLFTNSCITIAPAGVLFGRGAFHPESLPSLHVTLRLSFFLFLSSVSCFGHSILFQQQGRPPLISQWHCLHWKVPSFNSDLILSRPNLWTTQSQLN